MGYINWLSSDLGPEAVECTMQTHKKCSLLTTSNLTVLYYKRDGFRLLYLEA